MRWWKETPNKQPPQRPTCKEEWWARAIQKRECGDDSDSDAMGAEPGGSAAPGCEEGTGWPWMGAVAAITGCSNMANMVGSCFDTVSALGEWRPTVLAIFNVGSADSVLIAMIKLDAAELGEMVPSLPLIGKKGCPCPLFPRMLCKGDGLRLPNSKWVSESNWDTFHRRADAVHYFSVLCVQAWQVSLGMLARHHSCWPATLQRRKHEFTVPGIYVTESWEIALHYATLPGLLQKPGPRWFSAC